MTMHDRETSTSPTTPRQAPGLPIDVTLHIEETATGLVLRNGDSTANLEIKPDYVTYTLLQPELLVRFTIRPGDPTATVTTVANAVKPPDPNLLPDGPYVLPLNAEVGVLITYTPATQEGQTKPKKKYGTTLRVRPKGAPV